MINPRPHRAKGVNKTQYINIMQGLTQLLKNEPFQMFVNLQQMDKAERKQFIKWVCNLNTHNCGFLEYAAKPLYVSLIDKTECYFNGKGYSTPVKEFIKMGWYTQKGEKHDGTPNFILDTTKITL